MAVKSGRTSTADRTPTLKVGDPAPAIELVTHSGETFSLAALRGSKHAVLAFYPFAFSGT